MFYNKFTNFRIKTSYTKFIIYYTLLVYVTYNLINLDKLTKWFYYNSEFSYFGFISYIILGYLLFLTLSTLIFHKYTTKLFAIFIFLSSTFTTYFIFKYNIAMDTSMLMNILYTNSSESLTLASIKMIPYLMFLFIIPSFILLKIDIIYDKLLKHLFKSLFIIIISLSLALSSIYISFKELHRAANLSNKYILYSLVPVNFLSAIIDVIKKEVLLPLIDDNKEEKNKIIESTVTKKDDLVVVLAIGEAIRQKNLNIYGYKRKLTTPLLSNIDNLHILNGIARLGSTLYALREILRKDDIKLTSIINNSDINMSCYVNYSIYDNSVVGEIHAQSGKYKKVYDEDVIPLLEQNIKSYKNGYRFILLHLGGGAHGPIYSNRYPESFQIYTPTCENPDMLGSCTKEERFNSYDNAMLYQDYVISNIIEKLDNSKIPYVFIFVSDHGESLGEDGYVFHGMPPGMRLPPEQANVPLLVKASFPIKIINKDEYTQPDIFDTILDLFSIDTKVFDKSGSFIRKIN